MPVPPVVQQHLGDIPWVTVRGTRDECFKLLGSLAAQEIRDLIGAMPEMPRLRAQTSSRVGGDFYAGIYRESAEAYPSLMTELRALSTGSGSALNDLLLLNFRGDLGSDREGCSDIGWTDGTNVITGHNEDGSEQLADRCYLLTLKVEDEPVITTWWYPGFLPGNTFTVSESGLVWGMDSLTVCDPPRAPGRAFVARALQSQTSLDTAATFLRSHKSAGGWGCLMAQVDDPRAIVFEFGGGGFGQHAVNGTNDGKSSCTRVHHTNHASFLPAVRTLSEAESIERARILRDAPLPTPPSVDSLLSLLAREPLPKGVRAPGTKGRSATLCTMIVEVTKRVATFAPLHGEKISVPLDELTRAGP